MVWSELGITAGLRTRTRFKTDKPRLVTTVPQSGEASELLAATLEARATEPKVLCVVVVELMKRKGRESTRGKCEAFNPF